MSAEDERELLAQLAQVRVEQLVAEAASSLVTVGFVRTGLVPEAKDALDLQQARVAIEAVVGLVRALESSVPAAALQELKSAIAQLQLAYARAAEEAGMAPGPPPGAEPPAGPPPAGGRQPGQPGQPPPPRRPPPPRPKIWTPRGEV
jgi:hypothetical protein